MGHWIPNKESDMAELCQRWVDGLASPAYRTQFGWSADECTAISGKISAFLSARFAYEADNSTMKRMAKDEAKAAAIEVMRAFANNHIRYNDKMSAEYKLIFGVTERDTTPTGVAAPRSFPEAEPDTSIIRRITVHYWDSATKKRAKPHGVHGVEIRWALLDHPPAGIEALIHSDFDTATPFTLQFGEEDRGKRLYFCLRWETNTNLKGPYSEIYASIIP